MINRKLHHYIQSWSNRPDRLPLILRGARQVGKTTMVNSLGAEYDQYLYFNLEQKADRNLFEQHNDITDLVNALFLARRTVYSNNKRQLVFIDEVQEYPGAINQLRYFYETFPDIHVIASGSLLDFALGGQTRIPVGRVEYATLHPVNFPEFLEAQDNEAALQILKTYPTPDYAISNLTELFHEYINVGGMPKALDTYLKGTGINAVQRVYKSIVNPFKEDVEKYAKNATMVHVLRHIIDVLPDHVGERITFQKFGGSDYRSREVGEAFRALEMARIITLVYPTSDTQPPLGIALKKRPKLQYLDTGLMNHLLGIQADLIGIKDLHDIARGNVLEQAVYQELRSTIQDPRHKHKFWTRDHKGSAEVDLIIRVKEKVIPIEIKSGPTGSLRSLHEFIDRCPHHYGIRMYRGPWKVDTVMTSRNKAFQLLNIPYFLGTELQDIAEWFVREY